MTVGLPLNHPVVRAAALGAVILLTACLLVVAAYSFLVNALSDERIPITADASPAAFITAPFTDTRIGVNPSVLAAAVQYLPGSPRLQLRLAAFESLQFGDNWGSGEA